ISACFFFSSRRRHTRFSRDWSSDVCSSDLELVEQRQLLEQQGTALVQADAQFLQEIQSLRQDVQTLRQRTDALERYVLANEAARSEERRVGKEWRCSRCRDT